MERVISRAEISIQPLVERLTIGSAAGTSASLLTNDSPGPGVSATMILPPRYSYIEPGSYPHILDGQAQPQNQFHRQRQQHTDCKKLEGQILKQARAGEQLLLEPILGKQPQQSERDPFEVDGHQPVKEERSDQIETRDNDQSKNKLERISREEPKMQSFPERALRDHVVQVYVLIKHYRIVVPRLSRPEPDPAWTTNKCSD